MLRSRGRPVTMAEEDILPGPICMATVPLARLSGRGVETLSIEEIFALLGLRPDTLQRKQERHAFATLISPGGI